jgi:Tol biopolymer transport system component
MGEVYKALDTRLDRLVAIKVLPHRWADDTEMKERFEREAQAVASLNHPNICVLHDVGQQDTTSFLVMEYLEGETLARRLERGPLELEEALNVAIAIADALDKAHRRGVVHRDLKPSNVMLTPTGPKLLDFGLAKFKPVAVGAVYDRPSSPAVEVKKSDITTPGAILGTLQYMAPEQIEGIEADSRTDIFAFGALVHEMVTGKKAFEGKTQVMLMSAIAASETEALSKTQPAAPAALEHVVRTCLAKDPKDRWQTARDLLAELQWVAEGGAETVTVLPVPARLRKRQRVFKIAVAAAALLAAATALPASLFMLGPTGGEEFRIHMPLAFSSEPGNANAARVVEGDFAISPNGRDIAYAALNAGTQTAFPLFVRSVGSVTPKLLAGTEGATQPFWSADGRSIAFVAGGRLKKIDLAGGVPQDICDASDFFGGAWNAEGTIVFGSSKGLFRVSAQGGGKPEALTTVETPESGHYWPHFLPDGQRYLYLSWSGEAAKRMLFAGELGSKEKTSIAAAESKALYADPGFLLLRRENNVVAYPFDLASLKLSGEPVRVADAITLNATNGQAAFSVSQNGVLAYYFNRNLAANQPNSNADLDRQLVWVDQKGQVEELPQAAAPRRKYQGLALAPDKTQRIAVHSHDGMGGDVFVVDAKKNILKITQDASRDNSSPIWSPDGKWIAYASLQKEKWGLYRALADGSGPEELLYEDELPKAPMSWSPDANRIVFWVQDPKTSGDLWVFELDGKEKKATPFLNSTYNETHGQISPDGKWIAYASNATNNRSEIYVRPFPSGSAGPYQISFNGGGWPRWKGDTRELYYTAITDASGFEIVFPDIRPLLYAVATSAKGSAFEHEPPREILLTSVLNFPHSGGNYHPYDVSPDGQRFLFLQMFRPAATTATTATTAPFDPDPVNGLVIAVNWAKR